MNMYYNKLPQYVILNNEKFVINADYRIFIELEEQIQREGDNEAIYKALFKFYPSFSLIEKKGLVEEAVNKFIWFYFCGKEHLPKADEKDSKKVKQIFSYRHDADLIWASFWIYARIDISKGFLHWWKFKSIWNSLPQDCEFCKIKGYRAYEGDDKHYKELKEYYKLPPSEAEIKDQLRREQIYNALK